MKANGSPFDHFEWFRCILNNEMTPVSNGKGMRLIFPQALSFLYKNVDALWVAPTECWAIFRTKRFILRFCDDIRKNLLTQ